ncbi:helix-turn-helix transcriptional regulator [Mucilaginibacter robiniae]|uniref:Helix-turn-helix transcriptional regulator n=1 Tax=Mucilaginibacter robiniae TaxID=2728022 RepID=A0A7L5EBI4_9SPHI|nr:TetR/AcrR family transcriptional regulator [Mucilaginibacter robiniae]QJD98313.1 helix-turn-helix transcriptional regulator [Mucilaginibacter robiniae]
MFNEKGYAGTSLTDLIHATDLSKGCIYNSFKNKD